MRLLAIFAHPDDESFFCAGTLAKYAALGHEVYLICATRGEQGRIRHPALDASLYPKGEALGKLREKELEAACTTLGLRPPIFLATRTRGIRSRSPRLTPGASCTRTCSRSRMSCWGIWPS